MHRPWLVQAAIAAMLLAIVILTIYFRPQG
jgi:hypothetical protein